MNYRHAFHAGNHADVLKHAVLARIIEYLGQKDKPFAVLDAHAGSGAYDLAGAEAAKTAEWRGGIGLMSELFSSSAETILAPYRRCIEALNRGGGLRFYPGSPEIILQGLRLSDRVIANELHDDEAETLRMSYRGDDRLVASGQDALIAVKSNLPFKEKRGLVLLDPPYEAKDETSRVMRALKEGVKRFPTCIFVVWYPVTTDSFVKEFVHQAAALALPKTLRAELRIKHTHQDSGLSGSGLLVVNPPYILEDELRVLLPALAQRLGVAGLGRYSVTSKYGGVEQPKKSSDPGVNRGRCSR